MSKAPILPIAFSERMKVQLAHEYPSFEKSLGTDSPTTIRINPRKSYSVQLPAVPWCTTGKLLDTRPVFTLDPLFHAGAYYVQEASSMFLEQALMQTTDLSQNLRVLDLCGAPGGKSTHLLSLLSPDSLLVSNETIRTRAMILQENLQKWGSANSIVTNNDPSSFSQLTGFFDVLVVDAPCSGEGLFRKEPDAASEWSPDNVALCSKRQRRILADAWPALREGGILIYSTCTYSEEENEHTLEWLRDQHDVEFLPLSHVPDWGIAEVVDGDIRGYRFYPHRSMGEGFFLSAVRKTSSEKTVAHKKLKPVFQQVQSSHKERIKPWLLSPDRFVLGERNGTVHIIPVEQNHAVDLLASQLHIVSAGTQVCSIKHDKLIPEHALAMSVELETKSFSQMEVTLDEAITYLRKDTLQLNPPTRGYVLLTYQKTPLGWINSLGNRVNNLYPSNWRIRMQA